MLSQSEKLNAAASATNVTVPNTSLKDTDVENLAESKADSGVTTLRTVETVESGPWKYLIETNFAAEDEPCPEPNQSGFLRFRCTNDSKGKRNGFLVPSFDKSGRCISATYGNWADDEENKTWHCSGFDSLPEEQQEFILQQVREVKEKVNEERALYSEKRRQELEQYLASLPPCGDEHPYLIDKAVSGALLKQDHRGNLVIPLQSATRTLQTAQYISPGGRKWFWEGISTSGSFHIISGNSSVILIAEGYATAATLRMATGFTSVMAMNCGNLLPVAKTIRNMHPNSTIVICADNDKYKDPMKNPGVEKANAAARSCNASVSIPQFKSEEGQPTDFNDLANLEGLDIVRQQVIEQIQGIPSKFKLDSVGVHLETQKKDRAGKTHSQSQLLCSPVEVLALTRDSENTNWGRLIKITDPDGVHHDIAIPATLFAGDNAGFLPREGQWLIRN